jgi:16S rRNA (cytosine967-C5)-methyltransferase
MRRPRAEVRELALHSLVAAPTTLNTRYAALPLPANMVAHEQPGCHTFVGSRQELSGLLAERGDLWVQDAASCRAVEGARETYPFRQGLIVDMCAGQGTKTRHLAAAYPEATIYATDTDERRLNRLAEQFHGHERVQIIHPRDLLMTLNGKADLVLLDVPCTNTGVLARRVEARYRCDDEQLKRLTDIQKQIIADSITLLKSRPRGRILYSTCSLEPEENQAQADWAARWHSLKVLGFEQRFPKGLPGGNASAYSDGAFWAAMG